MEKLEDFLKEINYENLYTILGIDKTDDHSIIKKAYKKSARHYHPDKNTEKNTVEIFQKIQKSYDILKSEEGKKAYDNILEKKEITRNRNENLDGERRKFADDLKRREEEHRMKVHQENILKKKQFREEKVFDKSKEAYDFTYSEPKKKTFEEKLITSGIKIKWSKNLEYVITKDTLHSYFKEFGMIEEIICKQDSNKAFVLFNSDSNFNQILNSTKEDKVIKKLFKIKRLNKMKKSEKEDGCEDIKSAYLDSSVLNKLKNMKMQTNIDFMKSKDEKEGKNVYSIIKEKNDVPLKSSDEMDKKNDLFNLDLDDFEKRAFEKLKMKSMK